MSSFSFNWSSGSSSGSSGSGTLGSGVSSEESGEDDPNAPHAYSSSSSSLEEPSHMSRRKEGKEAESAASVGEDRESSGVGSSSHISSSSSNNNNTKRHFRKLTNEQLARQNKRVSNHSLVVDSDDIDDLGRFRDPDRVELNSYFTLYHFPKHRSLYHQSAKFDNHVPALSSENRYLKICGSYGLFANIFTTIAKAYSYAGLLNRTFVVADDFFLYWDRAALSKGPVAVLALSEYQQRHIPHEQEGCPYKTHPVRFCCRYVPSALEPSSNLTMVTLHARVLFLKDDLLWFLSPPHRHKLCIFRYLRPSVDLQREVDAMKQLFPPHFLGVHLRMRATAPTRARCIGHIEDWAWWYNVVEHIPWKPTGDECHMPPEYVQCWRNRSEGDTPASFFLGTDNLNVTATRLLRAEGGIRYAPTPALEEVMSRAEKFKRGAGAYFPLLVDIHVLAEAGEFLGNPVSSFSSIICSLRQARGLRCLNMPPDFYPGQCLSYPDVYHMFISWTVANPRRVLPGVLTMKHCVGGQGSAYAHMPKFAQVWAQRPPLVAPSTNVP